MSGGDQRVVVGEDEVRLDVVLARLPEVGSRRRAREVVARCKVWVDGKPVPPDASGRKLSTGAEVVVRWNAPGTNRQRARGRREIEWAGMEIVWQDAALVAVNKPPGLLTDAATGRQRREEDTVRKRLDAWLVPQGERAWPCHRIDRDTSGVVLFARDEETQAHVRDQFAAHTPERVYAAVVEGVPQVDEGVWTDWMAWDPRTRRQEVVPPGTPGAVEASARWRVVERFDRMSLLEVRLHSGRRNQIRVHLGSRRMPLVGERQYRPLGTPPYTRRMKRQALHAHRLSLTHPRSGEPVEVEAPIPSDIEALLRWLRRGER